MGVGETSRYEQSIDDDIQIRLLRTLPPWLNFNLCHWPGRGVSGLGTIRAWGRWRHEKTGINIPTAFGALRKNPEGKSPFLPRAR